VRFDPRTGFDAEARAEIAAAPLPPDASPDLTIGRIETLARAYLRPRPPVVDTIKERDRAWKQYQQIKTATATLRARPKKSPLSQREDRETAHALIALRAVLARMHAEYAYWNARVYSQRRGADFNLDLFYGGILQVWVEAGGKLTNPTPSSTRGALYRYVVAVMKAVTGKPPTSEGFRDIKDRWKFLAGGPGVLKAKG
jgi:hypothetical protein